MIFALKKDLSLLISMDMQVALVKRDFLHLAKAIAKQNASVRARYPHGDKVYQQFEQTFFGVFADIPVQLHVFLDVVEQFSTCSASERDSFAKLLAEVVRDAKRWAGAPSWDKRGKIRWKKSMPFAATSVVEEIERRARAFFRSVYAIHGSPPQDLRAHEEAFWARYKKMRSTQRRARRDSHEDMVVFWCLRSRMPSPIAAKILRLVN